ncbi:MAG: hypothetical protein HKN30_12600 [Sulfitobacter sp.]|nr:hypothetical protein [Sulfitobacter sp.]
MEKPDLEWLGWLMLAYLLGSLLWHFICRHVRDKTLKKMRTPLGAPIYTWKDPLGFEHSSRSHPWLKVGRGDGFFGGHDRNGCEGGDGNDCDGGDGGD